VKCRKCKTDSPKSEWKIGSVEQLIAVILAAPRIYAVGLPAMALNAWTGKYRNLAGRKSRKGGICPNCNAIHILCPDCEARHYVRASEMGSKISCRKCSTKFYFVPTGS